MAVNSSLAATWPAIVGADAIRGVHTGIVC
jgi:hypothetical protein